MGKSLEVMIVLSLRSKTHNTFSLQTSVAPLQIAIGNTTSVTDKQLRTASTCSVLGELFNLEFSVTMMYLFNAYDFTPDLSFHFCYLHNIIIGSMFARLVGGSLSDKYGASRPMGIALIVASIATALTSLVTTGPGLSICRFISGIGGGTMIISQAWIAAIFSKNIIGTAMGLVLGIGYTGNGFGLSFLGSAILPALTASIGEHRAWQVSLIITGIVGLLAALMALFLADDTPQIKYYTKTDNQSEQGTTTSILSKAKAGSIIQASKHYGTWILAFQYAMSSGTNSALLNIGTLHFVSEGASSHQASAITSAVGWLGVTCFMGGLLSDRANRKMGKLRGRYLVQFAHLVVEGILLIIFPFVKNFVGSVFIFITASMMATFAVGSTSALVPYVDKEVVGSVAGIVGMASGLGGIFLITLSSYLDYT